METPSDLAELLSHAGWLAELGRHLARPDVAEDAVQQTWMTALRTPPTDQPRPWLARVLRNFVHQRGRAEGRRAKYEHAAGGELTVEAADTLYDRVALERRLAARVMALDEHERRVVLLRYYQGLSSSAIARELGVPAGTVRWRLKTALDRLRAELDAGEQRDRWRAMVGATAGGVAMMTKAQIVVSVTLAAGLLVGGVSVPLARRAGRDGSPAIGERPAPGPSAIAPPPASSRPASGRQPSDRASVVDHPTAETRLPPPRFVTAGIRRASSPSYIPASSDSGSGHLDKDVIRAGIRAVVPEIKKCFESLMERDPATEGGRIVVRFVIEPRDEAGVVTAASIVPDENGGSEELEAPLAEQCILQEISKAKFPAPEGGGTVVVRYPFQLTPGRDKP
jgi:RNA polymerase sigma factor (sigma-70 family)